MVDEVKITDIDPKLDWAKNETLKSIGQKIEFGNKIWEKWARSQGINLDILKDQISENKKSQKQSAEDTDEIVDAVRDERDKIVQNLRGLNSTVSAGLRLNGDPSAALSELSSSLINFSSYLKYIAKKKELAVFYERIGIAVTTLSLFVGEVQKQNEQMIKLYSNGILVNNGFAGLARTASDLGVTAADASEILSKYGSVIAGVGLKSTTNLMKEIRETTNSFGDFKMNNKEALAAIGDTLEMLQSNNMLNAMNDKQRRTFTIDYIKNLNELSEATGKNREQLRKQIQDYAKTTNAFFALNSLPVEMRSKFLEAQASIQASWGDSGNTMMDQVGKYMQAGMATVDKDFFLALQAIGPQTTVAFEDLAKATTGNKQAQDAANKRLMEIMSSVSPEKMQWMMTVLPDSQKKIISDLSQGSQSFIGNAQRMEELNRRAAAGDKVAIKELEDRKKSSKALEDERATLNTFEKNVSKLSNAFREIVNKISPVVIPLLTSLSEVLGFVIDGIQAFMDTIERTLKFVGIGDKTSGVVAGGITTVLLAMVAKNTLGLMMGGNLLSTIVQFGKKLFTGGFFKASFEQALKGAGSVKGFSNNFVETIFGGLNKGFKAGTGILQELIGKIGKDFFGLIKNLGTGVTNAVKGLIGGIGDIFVKIGDVLSRAAKGMLKGLSEGLKALGGPDALKGAAGLVILSTAVLIAGKAFNEFNTVNWDSLLKAPIAIGEIAAAGVLAGKLGPQIIFGGVALGIAIGAIGGAMILAGDGFQKFNDIEWESLAKAGLTIGALGVAASLAGAVAPLIIAGGAALGIAIAAIGAGVAGASWMMGKALPTLADGMDRFAAMDGENLKNVGIGMISIGGGLAALTAGNIVSSIGSLASGFLSLFATDPVEQLKKFAAIGQPLKIAGDAISQLADGLPKVTLVLNGFNDISRIFSSGLLDGLFGSAIDKKKIDNFIMLFDSFAQARMKISDGASALEQIGNLNLNAQNMQALGNVFGGGIMDLLFGNVISTIKITKFIDMFTLFGGAKSKIVDGVSVLHDISKIDFNDEKIKSIQALGTMFSRPWYGSLFETKIRPAKVEEFVKIFTELGKHKTKTVDGIQTLGAISAVSFTAEKMKAIQSLSSMFTKNWFTDLFTAKIDEDQVTAFGNLLTTLGSYDSIFETAGKSIGGLTNIGIDENKIKGMQLLGNMFSSHWIGSMFTPGFDAKMVDSFAKIMEAFGNHLVDFKGGSESLKSLLGLDLTEDKVKSLSLLGSTFSSTSLGKMFTGDLNEKYISRLVGIFHAFGENVNSFKTGSEAFNALMSINIDKAKLDAIKNLSNSLSDSRSLQAKDINTDRGIFAIIKVFAANKETIDKGMSAINQLAGLENTSKGIDAIKTSLNGFGSNLFDGFKKFIEGITASDFIDKIQKLVSLTQELNNSTANIERFKQTVASTFNTGAPTTAAPTVNPVITTDQLNKKTLEYYDNSINRLVDIINVLERLHLDLNQLDSNADTNSRKLMDAITNSGNRVR